MGTKYKIYCDMDGVLTDFDKAYYDLTGIDIKNQFHNGPDFWEPINKAGVKFWLNMDWMGDGKRLWSYIGKYGPKILSAPSKKVESRIGKFRWLERELPGVELILKYASDKKDLSDPESILIDDRIDNIIGWREKGGIGIHHVNAKHTIDQLKVLGL
jgi:FMN phosphatase YigB (HAD superfamily)